MRIRSIIVGGNLLHAHTENKSDTQNIEQMAMSEDRERVAYILYSSVSPRAQRRGGGGDDDDDPKVYIHIKGTDTFQ